MDRKYEKEGTKVVLNSNFLTKGIFIPRGTFGTILRDEEPFLDPRVRFEEGNFKKWTVNCPFEDLDLDESEELGNEIQQCAKDLVNFIEETESQEVLWSMAKQENILYGDDCTYTVEVKVTKSDEE